MQAEEYRGAGEASQEALLFSLQTTQAREAAAGTGPQHHIPPPPLPTGNALGGLPAAILSYCQVRGFRLRSQGA